MKRKKFWILMLVSTLSMGLITGCGTEKSVTTQESAKTEIASTSNDTTEKDSIKNNVTADGQTLGLSGVENARELGGYYTTDGRKVKSGLLLRSAKLTNATEEDIKKLTEEHNLGTVVDLRTTSEIESGPDPIIEGVENIQIRILDEDDSSDNSGAAMTNIYSEDPVKGMIQMVEDEIVSDDMYLSGVTNEFSQQGYAEFFQVLLNNKDGKAILWHCTGGKDRAGTATVLVLSALGVDEETILDDFALTNNFYEQKITYMGEEAAKLTNDEHIIEGVKTLTGVSRDYMENMITTLNEEYGSVQNYIIEELGVSEEDIAKLQDMYLE